MKRFILCIILWTSIITFPAFSQECDPNLDPFCEDPDTEVPLDGGVGFLIGAATLYGLKKIKDKNTRTDE